MQERYDSPLLENLQRIYRAAAESDDGQRCCVMPSPKLQAKIDKELAELKKKKGSVLATMLEARTPVRVGFNDGLIYPGDAYPVGTPPSVVRTAAADRAPLRGNVRVIVVLVSFSDQAIGETRQHYQDLFFSTGVVPTGSVREYFTEVSNGQVTITGEVVGPYQLANTMAHYANGDSGTGSSLPNARTMAREAAQTANPDVDFSLYDNDNNGFVDAFIVIHAGPGAEVTGNPNHIWSHKWVLSGGPFNADGTQIFGYLTVPEDARIGVCCHELGHLLFGWIDFYDTDRSSSGLGNWCLMAGGSWNDNGDTPAHCSAWCKADQEWVTVENITTNQTVTIQDVKTGHTVYRLWKDGGASSEYFLVENRQKSQYDSHLPGDGLLIFHVDDTITSNSNESHPKVALIQADDQQDLQNGVNRGDDGDPYPGSSNNRTFNNTSSPDSKSYGDANTCVAVTSISNSGPSMTAHLGVRCGPVINKTLKDKLEKEGRKEFEKRFKEKERFKELVKEDPDKRFKELPDKRFKEKDGKEITEKRFEKKAEKPVTDKTSTFDKRGFEKRTEFPFGRGATRAEDPARRTAALEERLAALEEAVAAIEPFIGQELRPDLSQGALMSEEDAYQLELEMQEGSVRAKRLMDTKQQDY